MELLARRDRARRNKDFEVADAIRDDLLLELNVHVDDKERAWWPDGTMPEFLANAKAEGGRGRAKMETFGWVRGEPKNIPLDEMLIYQLLSRREIARRNREFDLADDLMDQLRRSGVSFCDDNSKVWYASSADDKISARRTGDWDCEKCGALVYGSKDVCFRCGNPRTMVVMLGADLGVPLTWEGAELRRGQRDFEEAGVGEPRQGSEAGVQEEVEQQEGDDAQVDEEEVEELIQVREKARRFRKFREADEIRQELMDMGVAIDDQERVWWVDGRQRNDRGGGRRDGNRRGRSRRSEDGRGDFGDYSREDLGWD
ncbi:hypothetical protein GUITHDRAFT_141172 [Guillardia theta CCMP2712]|uniref:RanBP2-type domain-containing protein n=1 Tax=Guillardia theta (strain CCMP2712) TaxID=905079 RepID=L1J2Y4_GUITC|nr:hypothetical protein GUITHDRAFT_141172 [Guillardia theta CCMP2712]EKX42499.1 hypothetical protein GUITHDRAFT_141172 [Guillardia theta CCMP2712]|eukprot:XP_005829479.1 hypothetical protein GUITHDRAFT_141172 [Guillardia theta CCMP2712]